MQNLYITQYSIGFVGPAILSLVTSGAIFIKQARSGEFTPDRVSLALYFLGAAIYNVLNFFGFSIYSNNAQIVWYIESFAPFIVLFLIGFAYYYPSTWREKERKIVLAAGFMLAVAAIMEYWIMSWNSRVLLYGQTYGAEYFSGAIPLLIAFFYLWAAIVFIRRVVYYERRNCAGGTFYKVMINPRTREARIARTFAGLILLDIMHSIIVYGGMHRISVSVFVIAFSTTIMVLVILSLYTIVYLNSAYDNIPFIYKLTGIPLVTILIMVTASSYLMMYSRSVSYDELNLARISEIKINEVVSRNAINLPVSYISVAGDRAWRVMYDKKGTLPGMIRSGLWDEAPSGMQMKSGRGHVDVGVIKTGRKYFIQVNGINYNQYNRRIGGTVYGFGIPYLDYLEYMQKTGLLTLVIMIVSILLIITLLPVLYYFGIVGPLHQILRTSSEEGETVSIAGNELHYIEKMLKQQPNSRKSKPFPGKPEEISAVVRQKLDEIAGYIIENYHDDISREGLASMIGLDPDYISRLFKIYTGMKIGDYINKLRIEEACRLLVSGDQSVLQISMTVGFESLRTFNRAFSGIMGETPTSFKSKNQQRPGQKQ